MKNILITATILGSIIPVQAQTFNRQTSCNVYYNSPNVLYSGVPCHSWFKNGRLQRVKVYLPNGKKWYDWSTIYSNITPDPRWKECIRFTMRSGNQYQVCTVKNPTQFDI